MKNDKGDKAKQQIASGSSCVELKYCERCGGLWLRECGLLEVYCAACVVVVAELPQRKKRPGRARLPVGPTVAPIVLGDFEFSYEDADDSIDAGSMGGEA